mmetsp:Transcript_18032/g.57652  ORF Transcript_18032/g.57652 Transcript_18032/m.57652 type:complete len:93 (-) Transcript_18032:2007-2285(-)
MRVALWLVFDQALRFEIFEKDWFEPLCMNLTLSLSVQQGSQIKETEGWRGAGPSQHAETETPVLQAKCIVSFENYQRSIADDHAQSCCHEAM